jgi:hypothetical protein
LQPWRGPSGELESDRLVTHCSQREGEICERWFFRERFEQALRQIGCGNEGYGEDTRGFRQLLEVLDLMGQDMSGYGIRHLELLPFQAVRLKQQIGFGVEDSSGMLKSSEHEVSSAEKEKGELLK